jgi:hypothetical protein
MNRSTIEHILLLILAFPEILVNLLAYISVSSASVTLSGTNVLLEQMPQIPAGVDAMTIADQSNYLYWGTISSNRNILNIADGLITKTLMKNALLSGLSSEQRLHVQPIVANAFEA